MSCPLTSGSSLDETIKCVASGVPVPPAIPGLVPTSTEPANSSKITIQNPVAVSPRPVDLSESSTAIPMSESNTDSFTGTLPWSVFKDPEIVVPKEEPMDQSDVAPTRLETGISDIKTTSSIASSSIATMDTDKPDVKPQLYCICRSKSPTDESMIGCDACNEWFHFDCVNISKTQANSIESYVCPPCMAKNPSLDIVYKKEVDKEKEYGVSSSNELRCGQCIGCYRFENTADCHKCEGCMSNESCLTKKCVQAEVLRKQQKDRERKRAQKLASGPSRGKRENRPTSKDDGDFTPTTSHQHSSFSTEKKKKGRKKSVRKENGIEDDDDEFNEGNTELTAAELHHRMMAEAHESFSKRILKKGYKNVPREAPPVQCLGPGCVMSATPPSKYCTDECGMRLAQARLDTVLPQRVKDYWENVPLVYKRGIEQGRKIDKQMANCRATNDKLLERMNRVARFIDVIKHIEPIDADEEPESSVDAMIACPVCTVEQSSRTLAKHVERCFVRSEKQTTFGTSTMAPFNPNKLFCDTHNKATDTYCKRLRVMCAEHYKGEVEAEMKICGFPTAWNDPSAEARTFQQAFAIFDDVDSMANCCQAPRKECLAHHRWIQTTLGILECERMHVLTRLDELWERRKCIISVLQSRGDLITLLSNKTTTVSPDSQLPSGTLNMEDESVDVNGCPESDIPGTSGVRQ